MALHNLKITVIDGGKAENTAFGSNAGNSGTSNSSGGSGSNKMSSFGKLLNYNSTIKNFLKQELSPAGALAVSQGVSLVVQTSKEFANFYISDIGRANGDSNYQSIVNRKIEVVTDTVSLLQSTISGAAAGAALGSAAGGIGIAIGAVLGATSSFVTTTFKYAERSREYQHEIFEEKSSQAYQLARANYSALTGRVR